MIDPTELVAVARNMLEPPDGNPSEAAVRRSISEPCHSQLIERFYGSERQPVWPSTA